MTINPQMAEVFPAPPLMPQFSFQNHLIVKPPALSTLLVAKSVLTNILVRPKKTLEDRFKQHLGYVANNINATGIHFNSPGHSRSDMTISVLEKVSRNDRNLREIT